MLNENSYLSFGPGTREQQEQIAAVAQAYQAGYNRGAAAGESASWALPPQVLTQWRARQVRVFYCEEILR